MDAIKRVISGDDMQGSNLQRNHRHEEDDDVIGMQIDDEEYTGHNDEINHNQSPTAGGTKPAVVENDMDMEAADFHIASASGTPGSSLSDFSASQRMMAMDEDAADDAMGEYNGSEADSSKQPPPGNKGGEAMIKTMQRSNPGQQAMRNLETIGKVVDRNSDESSSVGKTGGSQTSSRDWGWFEDVHASDGMLATSDSPGAGGQGRKQDKDTSGVSSNKRKSASASMSTGLPSQGSLNHESLQPIMSRDPETGESRTMPVRREFMTCRLCRCLRPDG